jgi:hypothetical protein
MRDSIVKQYKIPESCGKQLLVHGEESTYYSVLVIRAEFLQEMMVTGIQLQKAKKIRD